ncbi:efflux RND transporter periplasmic adaptor subunit [Geminicoccaceae bacterium 1502E]|nr:efflux RND transporter periplasmic adaptor subunit [Geminicoccaceae bacterium 1502E]
MLRSFVAILLVVLAAAGSGAAYWHFVMVPAQEQQQAGRGPGGRGGGMAVPVEAAAVSVAPAENTVTAVGTLLANESVTLRPEVAGRIVDLEFEEGGRVAEGQQLVRLDSSVERAELAQAEARLALARSNFGRARELRSRSSGTQRALDEAEAERRTAEAELELARARLAKRTIEAPFDGRAGLRRISVGEFVSAGTELVDLVQIDPLKVDFRVPEIFLASLRTGQLIELGLDAFRDETFKGKVVALDPLVDERGRAVIVRARLDNPDERLRPGLFARVTLSLAERAEALWIPEQAIVPQGGRTFVFRLETGEDGKSTVARLTEVVLGKRQPGRVEIVTGLDAGERVVTAGVLKIRDGGAVSVVPAGGEEPAAGPSAGGARLPATGVQRG